jgi:hypothetical protein
MRIGEALKLQLQDLDIESTPLQISLHGEYTKTGNRRVAFASQEAKETLVEWLKIRDEFLKNAIKRSNRYTKTDKDQRLFPFTANNIRYTWNNALQRSNHAQRDARTKRHELHIHTLRKFFRTNLATVIHHDVVEALMGHEGYLTHVYRLYDTKQLAEFYKQGEHVLTIFGNTNDIEKLQKDTDALQIVVNGLAVENTGLKTQLHEMEQTLSEYKRDLDHYRKRLDFFFKEGLPSFIESGELTLIMEKYIDRKMVELHTQLKKEFREIEEAEERFQAEFDK